MRTVAARGRMIVNTIYDPSCVLYMSGIPGRGSTIQDESIYNNHGTIYGATWTRLSSGLWVLSFDGVDDYIDCGTNNILNPGTGDFTVEFWAKANHPITDWATIIRKSNGDYSSLTEGWNLDVRHDNFVAFAHIAFANYVVWAGQQAYFRDNIWHQWALVGNRTAGTLALLRDVTTIGTHNPPNFSNNITSTQSLQIGQGGSNYYQDNIGLVRIYNRVLTATEILTHYNQERQLFGV